MGSSKCETARHLEMPVHCTYSKHVLCELCGGCYTCLATEMPVTPTVIQSMPEVVSTTEALDEGPVLGRNGNHSGANTHGQTGIDGAKSEEAAHRIAQGGRSIQLTNSQEADAKPDLHLTPLAFPEVVS